MQIRLNTEEGSKHLQCSTDGEFVSDEAVAAFRTALFAGQAMRRQTIFIDASNISMPAMAIEKLLFAFNAKKDFDRFVDSTGTVPRIALYGVAPFVSTYKPSHDFFVTNELPIQVFTDRDEALNWLDQAYA